MNKIMQNYYPTFKEYQALRNQMTDLLNDSDLSFRPGDNNDSLGAICRQIGEIEVAYIQSFKIFKCDFSYRHEEAADMETSVSRLRNWYAELDEELEKVISALSDEDIDTKEVDRGCFKLSLNIHLTVYAEALIIFYGKVSIYLKSMGKELPEQWQNWIG